MAGQLDYILFFYGLAFMVMAVLCLQFTRQKENNIEWVYLGVFALFHWISEWLDLIALSLFDNAIFSHVRVIVLAVSFFFYARVLPDGTPGRSA